MRLLMVSASLLLSTQAFAGEPVTSPTQTSEVPAAAPATGDGTAGSVSTSASVDTATATWSKPIIDRPYVLPKSKLQVYADTPLAHTTTAASPVTPESTDTSFGLHLGAGYGLTDKITAGAEYAFALADFEIKGPLAVFGEYQLAHGEKLSVAASADVTFDFDGSDGMGGTSVDIGVHAGVGARYLLAPKMAVYTGSPYGPGPVGRQFEAPTDGDSAITFDIPVGFAYQAMPQLFLYGQTQLLRLNLANKPANTDTAVIIGSDAAGVPLTLGGLYSLTKVFDITAAFAFPDLVNLGDKWGLSVGARWHN